MIGTLSPDLAGSENHSPRHDERVWDWRHGLASLGEMSTLGGFPGATLSTRAEDSMCKHLWLRLVCSAG